MKPLKKKMEEGQHTLIQPMVLFMNGIQKRGHGSQKYEWLGLQIIIILKYFRLIVLFLQITMQAMGFISQRKRKRPRKKWKRQHLQARQKQLKRE